MVAMVEVDLNSCPNGGGGMNSSSDDQECTPVPTYILVMFAGVTTVLISVYLFALMVATCILPNLQSVKLKTTSVIGASATNVLPAHERFQHYITIAWAFSTVLGIILFMAEFLLICWIKFWNTTQGAAWLATSIIIPVAFIFMGFALHFHRSLFEHKLEEHDKGLEELDQLANNLSNFPEDRADSMDSVNLLSHRSDVHHV
eukprot:sb/3470638/